MEEDVLRCLSCEVLLTDMSDRVCADCAPRWYRKTIRGWRENQ